MPHSTVPAQLTLRHCHQAYTRAQKLGAHWPAIAHASAPSYCRAMQGSNARNFSPILLQRLPYPPPRVSGPIRPSPRPWDDLPWGYNSQTLWPPRPPKPKWWGHQTRVVPQQEKRLLSSPRACDVARTPRWSRGEIASMSLRAGRILGARQIARWNHLSVVGPLWYVDNFVGAFNRWWVAPKHIRYDLYLV